MKLELELIQNKIAPMYDEPQYGCAIFYAPTFNCQIYSIAGIGSVLEEWQDDELSEDEIKSYFKQIQDVICKTELLIDIRDMYTEEVEKLFTSEYIIFKQPYRNNTGSDMVMYLLQTSIISTWKV